MQRIIIGARGSQLSLKQTDIVKSKLEALLPEVEIEVKVITTKGDKNMSPVPLDSVGKGWFTKEIDKNLLEGSIDMAVHSLKDLPETLEQGLIISALPEREDAREALISKKSDTIENLRKGAVIGTDSGRRASQLLAKRSDLVIKSLRGNVVTRLEKLEKEDYDAIVLAVAGLKRLGLEGRISQYFDIEDFIPSPGQGTLAVVTKEGNSNLNQLLKKLNHEETVASVRAERAFSAAVGGGCKLPVGAYAAIKEDKITLYAFIGSLDGGNIAKNSLSGDSSQPEQLGKDLANKLLDQCKSWYNRENDK